MDPKKPKREMPNPGIATCIIFFSFSAGALAAAGVRTILVARSGMEWPFELAMALFLLASAANFARQLIRSVGQRANLSNASSDNL
jgi:hypothetical protein